MTVRRTAVWLTLAGALMLVVAGVVIVLAVTGADDPGVEELPSLTVQRAAEPVVHADFERGQPGREPAGFVGERTGPGSDGTWELRREASDPSAGMVLAQTSTDPTNDRYPLLVSTAGAVRDVDVGVRFKTVSGRVDQAAGLVLRHTGPDDYYLVRANALENNIRFYTVIDGKRSQLAGADLTVEPQKWHTLRIVAKDDRFDVYFDERRVIGARNDAMRGSGTVGVWTKADSVTVFDDLQAWGLR